MLIGSGVKCCAEMYDCGAEFSLLSEIERLNGFEIVSLWWFASDFNNTEKSMLISISSAITV